MSDEAFKELIGHDPKGPNVVIMSVVVHPDYQGQGLAKRLMAEFIERMRGMDKATIHLMCKERILRCTPGSALPTSSRRSQTMAGWRGTR
jgi:GNAT superfamily N-acetyltransferase